MQTKSAKQTKAQGSKKTTKVYKHWTEKELSKMASMRAKGMTYAEIGERFGRHQNTVFTLIRRYQSEHSAGANAHKLEQKIDRLLRALDKDKLS